MPELAPHPFPEPFTHKGCLSSFLYSFPLLQKWFQMNAVDSTWKGRCPRVLQEAQFHSSVPGAGPASPELWLTSTSAHGSDTPHPSSVASNCYESFLREDQSYGLWALIGRAGAGSHVAETWVNQAKVCHSTGLVFCITYPVTFDWIKHSHIAFWAGISF